MMPLKVVFVGLIFEGSIPILRTRVLMDGGSSLTLLYQDTMRKMGIDPSRIKPTKKTFKGVIPGVEAHCTGSITLEVVFGSPITSEAKS